VVYATGNESTLYLSAENAVSFTAPESGQYNAISGDRMLVENGAPTSGLDDGTVAPRTAIGLDGSGQKLIIVVVDGRQPLYSQGATLAELAEIMMYYGADTAMNLDGGGSSTLVVQGSLGPRVLNSPIDNNIPGRERAVGNHLGIYAQP
jgi:exopolysaccharide biosynthesis protein